MITNQAQGSFEFFGHSENPSRIRRIESPTRFRLLPLGLAVLHLLFRDSEGLADGVVKTQDAGLAGHRWSR